jgi:fructokinase
VTLPPRIVVIGESLVDLVWPTGADTVRPLPGGSPANVALGLHRLDRSVSLVTCWGDDAPGALVARHLAGTGLDVRRAPSASGRTTVALASLDAGGGARYDFLAHWDPVRLDLPEDAVLLHTGSLAVVAEPGAAQVLRACRDFHGRPDRAVAVDLNVRPAVQPDRAAYRAAVRELAETADVVKASDEDLRWLWPDRDPAASARELLASGPALVVLTRGGDGACGFTAGGDVAVPAPRVAVVDTIGVGDAFQSALLAGLLDGRAGDAGTAAVRLPSGPAEVERLLRTCVLAGALATTRAGAQPPTLLELSTATGLS